MIENAVVQTDYSHTFKANKVSEKMKNSPYQALCDEAD